MNGTPEVCPPLLWDHPELISILHHIRHTMTILRVMTQVFTREKRFN